MEIIPNEQIQSVSKSQFKDRSAKRIANTCLVMSVRHCPPEGFSWSYLECLIKFGNSIRFCLKSDNHNRRFTCMISGVATFCGARDQQSQWPSLTEITNLKQSQLFSQFHFILSQFKIFWAQKITLFLFKIFISLPLGPGAATPLAPSPPPTPLYVKTYVCYVISRYNAISSGVRNVPETTDVLNNSRFMSQF